MSSENNQSTDPVHGIVMRAGGPLVKDYGTHFLRDDTEIRRSTGYFEDQIEAYSLFCVEPYYRVNVFGGPREWAIEQADRVVESIARNYLS